MTYRYRPERLDSRAYRSFALRSLSRLRGLPGDEASLLFQALQNIETWRQGQELIAEGAPVSPPRLVLEGWAVRQRKLGDGRRQIFGFLLPGDVFGLCSRPDNVAMCAVTTATPLISTPLPFLAEAIHGGPGALKDFAWHMIVQEEAGLRDQVVRLGRQSAHERLIHLLLEFYVRLKAVGMVNGQSFHLPLSQEVLADALGISVVHTNRVLQQLKREQLIETSGAQMTLRDTTSMARLVDYRPPALWLPQAEAQASLKVPSCSSTETVASNPSA